jgi:hypothetical protein
VTIQVHEVNIIIMNERCRLRAVSPVLWNSFTFRWSCSLYFLLERPVSLFLWVWFCSASLVKSMFSILFERWSQFIWSRLLYFLDYFLFRVVWPGNVLRKRIILKLFNTFNLYGIYTREVSSSLLLFSRLYNVSTSSCAHLTIIIFSSSSCLCHSSLLPSIPFLPSVL